MYHYDKKDGQFVVLRDKEQRMIVPKEETAQKLCIELNLAENTGFNMVVNQLAQAQRLVKQGFILVEVGSEIHRQLTVISPDNVIFVYMFNEEANEDQYFTSDLSLVLTKKREFEFHRTLQ